MFIWSVTGRPQSLEGRPTQRRHRLSICRCAAGSLVTYLSYPEPQQAALLTRLGAWRPRQSQCRTAQVHWPLRECCHIARRSLRRAYRQVVMALHSTVEFLGRPGRLRVDTSSALDALLRCSTGGGITPAAISTAPRSAMDHCRYSSSNFASFGDISA